MLLTIRGGTHPSNAPSAVNINERGERAVMIDLVNGDSRCAADIAARGRSAAASRVSCQVLHRGIDVGARGFGLLHI